MGHPEFLRPHSGTTLHTANGPVEVTEVASINVDAVGEELEAIPPVEQAAPVEGEGNRQEVQRGHGEEHDVEDVEDGLEGAVVAGPRGRDATMA